MRLTVGQRPLLPLVVDVGGIASLSGYTGAELRLRNPDGDLIDTSAGSAVIAGQTVVYTWPAAVSLFPAPGTYRVQIVLTGPTARDYTDEDVIEVVGSTPEAVRIVTAEQAYDLAGVTVGDPDIALAQLVVATELGVDLTDADVFAAFRAPDQAHVRTAVVWQLVYQKARPDLFTDARLANVAAAASNGSSVTFREGADAEVAPLALRALGMLSWRRPRVTASTLRPYRREARNRGPAPDPWVSLT